MKKTNKANQQELNLQHSIKDIRDRYVKNEPTKRFEIGERVQIGNLDKTIIKDILDDGQIYIVDVTRKERNGISEYVTVFAWDNINKYKTIEEIKQIPILKKENKFQLHYSQRSLSCLWSMIYNFGLDSDPIYQRDYVWELEDKVKLIDSIFHHVDIGKFLFVHNEYHDREDHKSYEVIDGKQRINALFEFYENRFPYKGIYFKDLHPQDKSHFENYPISYAEVRNVSMKDKLELFLKVNTTGKVIDESHLNKIREMKEEI